MRLFFALPLPPAGLELAARLRAELRGPGAGEEAEAHPGGRSIDWLPPSSLHLTLSFLGEQGAEGLGAARRALAALGAGPRPPLSFRPRSLALFPDRRRPRVLALLDPEAPDLRALRAELCRGLAAEARRAGLPPLDLDWPDAELPGSRPRRPFAAHCSLARIRAGADRPPLPAEELEAAGRQLLAGPALGAEGLLLDRLLLYESRPGGRGPSYLPLDELCLDHVSPRL